jgi:hypothetical protein
MKQTMEASPDVVDEHLQIQVPAITKRHLGIRAVETREPIRVIVLRALQAYGVPVPDEAIADRRKRRPT